MSNKLQINAIVGPTGCGKSAVANSLAFQTTAPVIVADRIQCFTDIPITTARTRRMNGILRYHLSDRIVSDGDYPAEDAFVDLLNRIEELTSKHPLIVLEGGSLSLLSRLTHKEKLPFQLSVKVMPIKDRGRHWQRLHARAMKMLCPDDGRPGTMQELSHAWRYDQQRTFVSSINGFEAILAWCQRNSIDPSDLGEHPPTKQGLADLAAAIANAHMDHSLEQEATFRKLFGVSADNRFTSFSTETKCHSEATSHLTFDQSFDQNDKPRVTVFCGARPGSSSTFTDATVQLGRSLASAGIDVVYGGGRIGLMGVLADTTLNSGGNVIGVIPRPMVEYEVAHSDLTTLHITETMHERKALMAQLGDAFIALPGGIGTAEELFEVLTWIQLGIHSKPCVLLNIEGFFDPLTNLLDHFVTTNFMSAMDAKRLTVVSDPIDAIDFIQKATGKHTVQTERMMLANKEKTITHNNTVFPRERSI
ncbi:MAG: TIGR00730 family Rossman fold protein [Candidatus Thiodiazotropha sp.]